MIYFARICSLIGAVLTFCGLAVLFLYLLLAMRDLEVFLPTALLERWDLMVIGVCLGAALLFVGQKAGNDLFRLRGKDSILKVRSGHGDSSAGADVAGFD